jgi:hypothetical protein
VYVFQSGKNIIVNSYALQLAGITRDTQDPTEPEGHIVRDAGGEPTGHLIAGAADMARARWWARLGQPPKKWDFLYFPREQQIRALEAQGRIYNACGVVAVRDMGVSVDEVEAYVDANSQGRLPVRVDLLLGMPSRYMTLEDIERSLRLYFGPKQGIGSDRLRIGGLKIVVQNEPPRLDTCAARELRLWRRRYRAGSGHPRRGRPRAADQRPAVFVGARAGASESGPLPARSEARYHHRGRPASGLVCVGPLAAHA